MNKPELVDAIAKAAGIPRTKASKALDGTLDAIRQSLKDSEPVSIVGFGTFEVRERGPRMGRNPRTGESIQIAASRSPTFRASRTLKDAIG
ncbi:MAG: HU family DNA-binding protein [Gammaproteobacteria bacterium]|nr:HU family DNA-binding protein [Gammaproteobacteria bacterium]MYB37959.1 HU family DNA-binding protein [Gammaproteobacteria bacterium]